MKQFSLEEYLENPERKVVTRDGCSARIICTDANSKHQIVALVQMPNNVESPLSFYKDGRFLFFRESENDLFFAPQIQKRWSVMILATDITERTLGSLFLYETREEAEKFCGNCHIVEITWEE